MKKSLFLNSKSYNKIWNLAWYLARRFAIHLFDLKVFCFSDTRLSRDWAWDKAGKQDFERQIHILEISLDWKTRPAELAECSWRADTLTFHPLTVILSKVSRIWRQNVPLNSQLLTTNLPPMSVKGKNVGLTSIWAMKFWFFITFSVNFPCHRTLGGILLSCVGFYKSLLFWAVLDCGVSHVADLQVRDWPLK